MSYTPKTEELANSRKCNKCLHDLAHLIRREATKTTNASTCENNGNSDYAICIDDGNILKSKSTTVNDSYNLQEGINDRINALIQCDACNMVQYCSRKHQIDDLQTHKEFCDIMKMVKDTYHVGHPLLMFGPLNANKMQLCSKKLKSLIYVSLRRQPTKLETELITYPAYCAVCYELYNLIPCRCCLGVSYCSAAHMTLDKQKHKAECHKLRIYYCLYKSVPLQRDPYDDLCFRMANLQNSDLIEAVERATCVIMPKNPTSSHGDYITFAIASSFSYIGTICLGMSYLELDNPKGATYTMFVIGTTDEESLYFQNMHLKFFFLQNDKITKVELHFIGHKAYESNESVQKYIFKDKVRTVTYKNFIGPFQQYIKKEELRRPSMIVAFNPGFNERAGGDQTISSADLQAIVRTHQVPIFITSPTELDAKLDYTSLLAAAHDSAIPIRCLRILDLSRNPYSDMRPFRNHRLNELETICYKNKYIQGVLTML